MTTLIQDVEKGLGREPPMPRSERLEKERWEERVEEAKAAIQAKAAAEREAASTDSYDRALENSSEPSFVESVVASSGSDPFIDWMKDGKDTALVGASVVLAILVVALSIVTLRLSRRNKRMRESTFFSDNLISGIGKQSETFIWFHRNSKKNPQYKKFLVDLKKLVKQHHEEHGIHVTMNEGWRDK